MSPASSQHAHCSVLDRVLNSALTLPGPCVFLTGAGISQESGIPTFRGSEGYWRVGTRNYYPEELATHAAFQAMPETLWNSSWLEPAPMMRRLWEMH